MNTAATTATNRLQELTLVAPAGPAALSSYAHRTAPIPPAPVRADSSCTPVKQPTDDQAGDDSQNDPCNQTGNHGTISLRKQKADVMKRLEAFDHVGLLFNGPVAATTCPSPSHPTNLIEFGNYVTLTL